MGSLSGEVLVGRVRDIVELWRMAYIEIPVEIFHFQVTDKRKENDKTDHRHDTHLGVIRTADHEHKCP